MFLAKVFVTLKPTVNDPQGLTVLGALKTLGFESVASVRLGKYLEVQVNESERSQAEAQVSEMCRKLLANPVIEEFSYQLEELASV
ncbi:MAG: phosphoribosylformylglycinamidine synthase subunit PurS [Chloroflexi bacterium]|nr:phosphoribosylformylglycinamidine synthase subunit PurS [Chloroflexota bacterium]MDA1218186.1 phosphoribosylformylglycinamidine synthase subunit PurS [Chloroflexota bacterium]PKB57532.1 MAG: phosphoribosylformylglycinamidine synthase [SAR202 cluster bacterium Casp-Chloro-G3]